jgi:hypothetical protein
MVSPLDDKHAIRLVRAKGKVHAHLEGLAIYGSGASVEAAIAALEARYAELQAFSAESGLSLSLLAGGVHAAKPGKGSGWKAAALVVVCFGLMTIPLSYALSSAVERAATNMDLKGGRQFWTGIEDGLIKAADPASAPDPEKQVKTVEALHTLALRLKPYADAVKPLFADQPSAPKEPAAK